jgi:hypothetical protein
MDEFTSAATRSGFTMKLWRGERMCLIAFDVAAPEPDLVGFAIECMPPGAKRFAPLMNRLAFSYDKPLATALTGDPQYSSKTAPFQKFRWVHFPFEPTQGSKTWRRSGSLRRPTPRACRCTCASRRTRRPTCR